MPAEDDEDREAFLDPDDFGVAARYTRAGAAAVDLNVILDEPAREQTGMGEVAHVVAFPKATCRTGALPAGATEGDRLEIVDTGRVLLVKAIVPDSTGMARLELEGWPARTVDEA